MCFYRLWLEKKLSRILKLECFKLYTFAKISEIRIQKIIKDLSPSRLTLSAGLPNLNNLF